jgi:hypothetical protein
MRIVFRAYKFLPEELKPRLERGGGSMYEYYFPDINSRIYCDLESRGDTIQNLHISEAAFIKDVNRMRATIEAVPLNGRVTIETTPNGMGNHFYDEWIDSSSTYENLFFPWFVHDEYEIEPPLHFEYTDEELELIEKAKRLYGVNLTKNQIAFRRQKKSELKQIFQQEYPEDDQSCFLSSGDAVLDLAIVKEKLLNFHEPIYKDSVMRIYKKVDKNSVYVIGADTAEGKGTSGDYSAAVVFDSTKKEMVAVLHARIKPSDFAHALKDLADHYVIQKTRYPLLAVERNNHGHAVLLELDEHIQYPNLFKSKDGRPGWVTDRITRPIMINGLVDAVESGNFNFTDRTMLEELLTLINNNGKIEAVDGKHDDLIIASSIGLQMCIEAGVSDIYKDIGRKILL